MEFSERVLILGVGKFKESDLWVRLLSPTRGMLSAFAFGGSRSKRRFIGCLDVFNEVLFRIDSAKRGLYLTLQEGVLMQGTSRLRKDWARHGLAMNCIHFTQSFGVSADGAGKAYALLTQVLDLLEHNAECSSMLPLFYRMRFVFDQGYAFDIRTCAHCGCSLDSGGAFLFVQQGQILCPKCKGFGGGALAFLNADSLHTLTCVAGQPVGSWPMLERAEVRSQCARAIEGFIQYHVGLSWKNGRFMRD